MGKSPSIRYLYSGQAATVSKALNLLSAPRGTGLESLLDKQFLMKGSHVPSHPREQLPKWRLFQNCTKLQNYKAKAYGDFAES